IMSAPSYLTHPFFSIITTITTTIITIIIIIIFIIIITEDGILDHQQLGQTGHLGHLSDDPEEALHTVVDNVIINSKLFEFSKNQKSLY
ncbi:hypothetical protein A6R68_15303, partial [Neotoma lepida]